MVDHREAFPAHILASLTAASHRTVFGFRSERVSRVVISDIKFLKLHTGERSHSKLCVKGFPRSILILNLYRPDPAYHHSALIDTED